MARRGCACSLRQQRGGFYPSVMSGVTGAGPYFITAAFAQGVRLLKNNKTRIKSRRSADRATKAHTRRRKVSGQTRANA